MFFQNFEIIGYAPTLDVLSRFGELGISVTEGIINFNPSLINREEFLEGEESFIYYDIDGEENKISIAENSLAYTFCQVPVVYTISDKDKILVIEENKQNEIEGLNLDKSISESIFNREGKINRIEVSFNI